MPTIIAWAIRLLAPYALYIMLGVAVAGGLTGMYFKIRHDEKVRVLQKVEKEKANAIQQATTARNRVRELCQADPANCTPDDEFRD